MTAGALWLTAIVLLGSCVQWLTGMGFALVAVPALILLLGPSQGVILANCASGVICAIGLAHGWREVRWAAMVPLCAASACTVPLGTWTTRHLPEPVLLIVMGSLVTVAVLLIIRGLRAPALRGRAGGCRHGRGGRLHERRGGRGRTPGLPIRPQRGVDGPGVRSQRPVLRLVRQRLLGRGRTVFRDWAASSGCVAVAMTAGMLILAVIRSAMRWPHEFSYDGHLTHQQEKGASHLQ